MKVGLIGLGKMGSRMVGKLIDEGHEVSVWNRSKDAVEEFKIQNSKFKIENQKLKVAETIKELVRSLEKPRIIWVMVPHIAVEEVLTEVRKFVSPGDIVIDGGNSFYKDTDRRFEEFEKAGIKYLGIGVSGGIIASEKGYPMMVGGNVSAYQYITTILDALAKPNGGHEYFGTGGAGHFVKMVHNGIEYGMMQSIGEGFEILEKSRYKFDLAKIARIWQKGTIVSGFLIDLAEEALRKDYSLSSFAGPISRSGECDWAIETAKEEGLDPEVIDESLEFRKKSEIDPKIQNSFTAKMINALRRSFGGHPVRPVRKPQGEQAPSKGGQAG